MLKFLSVLEMILLYPCYCISIANNYIHHLLIGNILTLILTTEGSYATSLKLPSALLINTLFLILGLCAFSPCLDGSFLALPASTTKGSVLVYNVMDLHLHCEVVLPSFELMYLIQGLSLMRTLRENMF